MGKSPQNPKDIFPEIISDYGEVFGDGLKSIILFGSAARGTYRPGKSDINFMIVLSDEEIENLDRAFSVVTKWRKKNVAIPLFLTEHYVESSLDVFPIEYLTFRNTHELVYGVDILKELVFEGEHIRLQCEREIKGKLLLLREAYLETSGKGRALKEVIAQSLPAFMAIFEALVYLTGKDVPHTGAELIAAVCDGYGLEQRVFENLLKVKEGTLKPADESPGGLFKAYVKEIRALAIKVDSLGG